MTGDNGEAENGAAQGARADGGATGPRGEALERIRAREHPLVSALNGFRVFPNAKAWRCTFCARDIAPHEGYWGSRRRFSGSREYTKACHQCFLALLTFFEENPNLDRLLRRALGRERQWARPPP